MHHHGPLGYLGKHWQFCFADHFYGATFRFQHIFCYWLAGNDLALCEVSLDSLGSACVLFHLFLIARWDSGNPNSGTCKCTFYCLKLDLQFHGSDGDWSLLPKHKLGDIHRSVPPRSTENLYVDRPFRFLVFASLNAFIIPVVYFFFPETAGRSLEGGWIP